jgi:hypothetical protein
MAPTDLLQALRRRPFQPFRLHVSDGTSYDICHPGLLMVTEASAVVGFPAASKQPQAIEGYEIVDLAHIIRLESLEEQTPAGDGQ